MIIEVQRQRPNNTRPAGMSKIKNTGGTLG